MLDASGMGILKPEMGSDKEKVFWDLGVGCLGCTVLFRMWGSAMDVESDKDSGFRL